jgi:hypothetical protein
MEQVYYTQCPPGHGLGATGGFQVKRLSAGFPASSDFRHLGLRAFLPGSRVLAPPSLRYRRDGQIAEIAWLTPRTHEYQTAGDRLWGRPGGQFAHGVRLDRSEMAALLDWPAGLHDASFWRSSDPEPTLGREPDAIDLHPGELRPEPRFAAVQALIAGAWKAATLARLWTALARASRSGGTLVFIESAARLAPLVQVLTFALPVPLRGDVTFSTFHDRPEELTGFRLQGTVPEARPNRAVLSRQGAVADLTAPGTAFEGDLDPEPWAHRLASWWTSEAGEEPWSWTAALAARWKAPAEEAQRWSAENLGALFEIGDHLARDGRIAPPPDGPDAWRDVARLALWSHGAGFAEDWARSHAPSWWEHSGGGDDVASRGAFITHLRMGASWRVGGAGSATETAARWGDLASRWLAQGMAPRGLAAIVSYAPRPVRGAFLARLSRGLPGALGDALLAELASRSEPGERDEALLLPVAASRAAAGGTCPEDLLPKALNDADTATAVLEGIASELPPGEAGATPWPGLLADALERRDAPGWVAAWAWALGRGDEAASWCGPIVARVMSHPDGRVGWETLGERTPPARRAVLAKVWLDAARGDQAPADALVWGVDRLFLPLPEADRPGPEPGQATGAGWASSYLDRVAGLDLARWLFRREGRRADLARWLEAEHQAGRIESRHRDRLRIAKAYPKLLSRPIDASAAELPDVPPSRRGELLAELLAAEPRGGEGGWERLGGALAVCRRAWPSGFEPFATGLDGIARAVAGALASEAVRPDRFISRLAAVLDHLDRPNDFGPEGFAAAVVAAAVARESGGEGEAIVAWPLRRALFLDDRAWRALVLDARADLPDKPGGGEELRAGLSRWDRGLVRGRPELEGRFHELMVHAAPGPRALAAVVAARARSLAGLNALSWWGPPKVDLRDAVGRLMAMAPLDPAALTDLRRWMRGAKTTTAGDFDLDDLDLGPGAPVSASRADTNARPAFLSPAGHARWKCIDALSVLARNESDPSSRFACLRNWVDSNLPLDVLETDDRAVFLAYTISLLDRFDPDDVRGHLHAVDRLAAWLVATGAVSDPAIIRDWTRALPTHPPDSLVRGRRALVQAILDSMRDRGLS